MTLTTEQLERIDHGELVPVEVDGKTLYVISDSLRQQVEDALEQQHIRDTYAATLEVWDAEGSPEDATLYK